MNMSTETKSVPYLNPTDKVVIIVDLMVGIAPLWASSRDDLYKLIAGITGMNEDEAKDAIQQAKEKRLIKYFNPYEDEQD